MGHKWIVIVWLPLLAAAADSSKYIVELSGDPVSEHIARESKRTGKKITMDSEMARTRRDQIRQEQKQMRAKLEDLGVKVLDSTQNITNSLIVRMPDDVAEKVAGLSGVKRVQKVREFKQNLDHAVPLHKVPQVWNQIGVDKAGLGVKIAIIDTGIDITHPAMQDSSLQIPAGFPRTNADSDVAFTNSKVIVARSYAALFSTVEDDLSARDVVGHGTATAMAAAGAQATGPLGPIVGVAPKAYLGSYKVLGAQGSGTSDVILKAIDDAVADGMDVISASISSAIAAPRLEDDIEAAAFERVASTGILMINSVGNKFDPNTIGSPATAASVIGVGASWSDRVLFPASVQLTAGPPIGSLIFSDQAASDRTSIFDPIFPGGPITGPLFDVSTLDQDGEACLPFPTGSLTGKVALIIRSPASGGCTFETKINDVQNAGAVAALIYTRPDRPLNAPGYSAVSAKLPAMLLFNSDGVAIKRQITANPNVTATLNFTIASISSSPDGVGDFSSKGPNVDGSIKPDLVAVGSSFITATETTAQDGDLYDPSGFTVADGTSFAAPLVAGGAALLKGARPGLTAAQYRSLLINTAAPITARVQEAGAGFMDMSAALRSTFAAAPTSLSFQIGGADPNLSKTLTISNIGASAESYSLTVSPRDAGGPAAALGSSTVTIQPGQSATIPVNFTASGLTAGQYEGFVLVRGTVSGVEERVPYWYGVASDTPKNITPLFVVGFDDNAQPKAGATVNNAIYFRVTDASGIVLPNVQPTVAVDSGGGAVIRTTSLDRQLPGVFSVSVRLGVRRGDNLFSITVGDLAPIQIDIVGN